METQPGSQEVIEASAFDAAVAKYAAMDKTPDDVPEPPAPPDVPEPEEEPPAKPNKHVEGEELETPEPEEKAKAGEGDDAEEFVEFQGAQLKRFNKVYGRMRSLERQLADVQRQPPQPPAVPQYTQPPAAQQPQPFLEPQPKLSDFADVDQWANASTEWAARKARYEVRHEMAGMFTQQQQLSEQQRLQAAESAFVNGKIGDGQKRFGQAKFDQTCNEVCTVIPQEAFVPTVQRLMRLDHYPDVVMELAKDLPRAERIFRLPYDDQIYELKALDRKVAASAGLAFKQQKSIPTKVEAAGQGEPARTSEQSLQKIRQSIRAGGGVKAAAKYFEVLDREAS